MTSVYAIAAMVGDGSSSNPRRPTMWGRLDNVLSVIDTQNVCLKADGTVDIARISQISFGMAPVYDFDACGVVVQTMDDAMWALIRDHLLSTMGYVVWGFTLSELKQSVQDHIPIIQGHLQTANITLSGNGTLFDQAIEAIGQAQVTGPNGNVLKGMRDFYLDRLSPPSLVEAPPIIYKLDNSGSLDPAKFTSLIDAVNQANDTDMAHMFHELYDLACFDLVDRSLVA